MFSKFWTRADIGWSTKLDNSASHEVRFEMEWLVYCIVLEIGFTQNPPTDSSHHIMLFPKFWTQSDIDWSMKLDTSGSYELRSKKEWFVFCLVFGIGFHSKRTKWLLPPYYDVPQGLDSIRYQLVHEIGQFRFIRSSFWNWVVGILHRFRDWISLLTKWLLPRYYVVPQVLDSIRFRLVDEIGLFMFVRSS